LELGSLHWTERNREMIRICALIIPLYTRPLRDEMLTIDMEDVFLIITSQ
jgi:hypothetical protein